MKKLWYGDIVFEELPVVGTRLTLDFYNANQKIAIEVQGAQHSKYVKHFHDHRVNFLRQLKRDEMKQQFCDLNSILLIEIYPDDPLTKKFFQSAVETQIDSQVGAENKLYETKNV